MFVFHTFKHSTRALLARSVRETGRFPKKVNKQ